MPSPTESPQIATAAPGFDPVEFWYLHKTKIVGLLVLFLVALTAYAVQQWIERQEQLASARAFAGAKTTADFQKVIAEHEGTVAAANAHLRLAELQRNEGKLEESTATLKRFVERHPHHPMISGAWLSIGANQEAQGKTDDALATYQKVASTYPLSYATPLALLAQGRLHKAKGNNDLAKRTYEQIITQFQNSDFAQQALGKATLCRKPAHENVRSSVCRCVVVRSVRRPGECFRNSTCRAAWGSEYHGVQTRERWTSRYVAAEQ